MRPDQLTRLRELAEKVTDEALTALDTELWPGAKVAPEEWDAKIRGDRNWTIKNANAAVALLVNMKRLTEDSATTPTTPEDPEAAEERAIARAEAAASELLEKVGKGGRRNSAKN